MYVSTHGTNLQKGTERSGTPCLYSNERKRKLSAIFLAIALLQKGRNKTVVKYACLWWFWNRKGIEQAVMDFFSVFEILVVSHLRRSRYISDISKQNTTPRKSWSSQIKTVFCFLLKEMKEKRLILSLCWEKMIIG